MGLSDLSLAGITAGQESGAFAPSPFPEGIQTDSSTSDFA